MSSEERGEEAGGVTTQVREKGQEVAAKVQDQVQEKTGHVRGQASDRLREQVNRRSTEIGEQGESVAEALRRAGAELEGQDKQTPARVAHQLADRIEQISGYLRDADADRILADVEGRVRRRPWVAAGSGALLGLLASRFVKASSARRYEQRGDAHRGSYPGELVQAQRDSGEHGAGEYGGM